MAKGQLLLLHTLFYTGSSKMDLGQTFSYYNNDSYNSTITEDLNIAARGHGGCWPVMVQVVLEVVNIAGLTSNTLTVVVLVKYKDLRSAMNTVLASQFMVNICLCIFIFIEQKYNSL